MKLRFTVSKLVYIHVYRCIESRTIVQSWRSRSRKQNNQHHYSNDSNQHIIIMFGISFENVTLNASNQFTNAIVDENCISWWDNQNVSSKVQLPFEVNYSNLLRRFWEVNFKMYTSMIGTFGISNTWTVKMFAETKKWIAMMCIHDRILERGIDDRYDRLLWCAINIRWDELRHSPTISEVWLSDVTASAMCDRWQQMRHVN